MGVQSQAQCRWICEHISIKQDWLPNVMPKLMA